VRSEVGQLFGRRRGGRRESRAKRKNNHLAVWAFSTFVDRYTSRAEIVSFRQFSVTEKAFARKKKGKPRDSELPSELAS
jgi:hypothetical protein